MTKSKHSDIKKGNDNMLLGFIGAVTATTVCETIAAAASAASAVAISAVTIANAVKNSGKNGNADPDKYDDEELTG